MKRTAFLLVVVGTLAGVVASSAPPSGHADEAAASIFGGALPPGYRDWKLISVAHEEGNLNDLRANWETTWRSRPTGKTHFRSRTAPSSPGWPGVMNRRRKTTRPLADHNLLWPGHRRTGFNLWSRIQKSISRREAGDSLNSSTANLSGRRCSKPVFDATNLLKLVTLSLPITHLDTFAIEDTKNAFAARTGNLPGWLAGVPYYTAYRSTVYTV